MAETLEVVLQEIERVYPATTPSVSLTNLHGSKADISSLRVFWNPAGHWHFIPSSSLIELHEKQSPNPDLNGWGFELSYRLEATEDERKSIEAAANPTEWATLHAPMWPLALLTDLVQRVWNTQRPYAHGHFVRWYKPGTQDPRGQLVIVDAPQLQSLDTPNGGFRWLQAVSIDEAMLQRLASDDYQRHLDDMAATNPLFVSPRAFEPPLEGGRVA